MLASASVVPRCLTIATSDSGGGAGIQADLKAFARLGCHGMSAIVALTAQSTTEVRSVHEAPPGFVRDQLDVLFDDIGVDAAKTGMLFSARLIETVAELLDGRRVPLVVDPVMVAASGAKLLQDDAVSVLVERLFPLATVVTPNLHEAARGMEVELEELLPWVVFHEVTHAVQFNGVPWLREHLAGLVGQLLTALDVDPGGLLRMPDLADLRGLFDRVRDEGLAFVVVGDDRRAQLESAQAFMALLEGYAEHVMDAVGASMLGDLDAMRAAMDRRRHERSGMLRVLEKLIGMDLKLRQYKQGKEFCDAVVGFGGIAALNRAWAGPEALPTFAELDDPLGWLGRTERLGLGRGAA